jgi:RNA polymerase sigma-70 factor, ECF subfamily
MAAASDNHEWRAWIEEFGPRFLLFAKQQSRNVSDAEDLLQESVVECWKRSGGERPPDAPLVYATIRRRAIDRARSADRRMQRETAATTSDEPWFIQEHGKADEDAVLKDTVGRLPPEQQEVLTMKIWGELTFQQISEVLHIPMNTAASRYRYALENLRKMMSERP